MLVLSLTPQVTHWVEFSAAGRDTVPERPGCYALTTEDEIILYIGESSVSIRQRVASHLREGEKTKGTLLGRASRVYYKIHPAADTEELEQDWLEQHENEEGDSPYFND